MRTIFWVNAETTGVAPDKDQILEISIDVEIGDQIIESYRENIELRADVRPSPLALFKNNINPYDTARKAKKEHEVANEIKLLAQKHSTNGLPVMAAYDARLERSFMEEMMLNSGESYSSYFNVSQYDPKATASSLISSGSLKISNSSIRSIASTLNIDNYATMENVKLSRAVSKKLFQVVVGRPLDEECIARPKDYNDGDDLLVVTSTRSSGVKKRQVSVVKNDHKHEIIFCVDKADLEAFREKRGDTLVKAFNYASFVADLGKPDNGCEMTQNEKNNINKQLAAVQSKISFVKTKAVDTDILEKATELSQTCHLYSSAEELNDKYPDAKTRSDIISRAMKMLSSKGAPMPDWFSLKEDTKVKIKKVLSLNGATVVMHPSGRYILNISVGNSKTFGTKYELYAYIKNEIQNETAALECMNLPEKETFINTKHPIVIRAEIAQVIAKNPDSESLEHIRRFKADYPNMFAKEDVCDNHDDDADDFVTKAEGEIGGICALCGRGLTSRQSIEWGMGKRCRAMSSMIERGLVNLEKENFTWTSPSSVPISKGRRYILKITSSETSVSGYYEVLDIGRDGHMILIDRKKMRTLIDAGTVDMDAKMKASIAIDSKSIISIAEINSDHESDNSEH